MRTDTWVVVVLGVALVVAFLVIAFIGRGGGGGPSSGGGGLRSW